MLCISLWVTCYFVYSYYMYLILCTCQLVYVSIRHIMCYLCTNCIDMAFRDLSMLIIFVGLKLCSVNLMYPLLNFNAPICILDNLLGALQLWLFQSYCDSKYTHQTYNETKYTLFKAKLAFWTQFVSSPLPKTKPKTKSNVVT